MRTPTFSAFWLIMARAGLGGIAALVMLADAPSLTAQSPPLSRSPFVNSIMEVSASGPNGSANPHHATIVRRALASDETGATMEIEVALKMRNFADLQSRVHNRELVARREMAAKYDPLASDYDKVAGWLTSQGLTITQTDPSRLAIFAKGKVSEISQAFQVTFARVTAEGSEYTSAITAPSMPADIAAVVLGINGLQPHIRAHPRAVLLQPASTSSFGPPYLPSQLASAYNASSVSVTGAGQTIAVVIDAYPSSSDLTTFWSTCGVNQSLNNITHIPIGSGPSTPPQDTSSEATLDTEWSSSIAPGAKVRIYGVFALDFVLLDEAYQQIFNDLPTQPGLKQVSLSYGLGESYEPTSQLQTDDAYFAELASAGVTIFAASGDGGSNPDGNGGATGPLQAESPASDPNVTGVGGTSLILNATSGTVVSETVWNTLGSGSAAGASGGGVSSYFVRPSWQTGPGLPGGTMRCVPDVALAADPNYGGLVVFNGQQWKIGGTSLGVPTWAAFCALINQARANAGLSSVGMLGPNVYPLIGTASLNDITVGNNGAYSAGAGYDLCTGVGTPNLAALIQALVLNFTTQPASQTVLVGANVGFSAAATGNPTYQWYFNGAAIGGATGATLFLNNVQLSAAGSYTVIATDSSGSVTSRPAILSVQLDQVVMTGHSVTLLAGAGSQWQVSTDGGATWTNLTDNGTYSGTATGTLMISNATSALNGYAYRPGSSGIATVLTVEPALFPLPTCIVADASGNLYVGDGSSNTIQEIGSSSAVSLIAGSAGSAGSADGTGSAALFRQPAGITINNAGILEIADTGNSTIRQITPSDAVTTFVGSAGKQAFQNGNGTSAWFNQPVGISLDSSGNLYVADANNDVIRLITSGGAVSTFVGTAGTLGSSDGTGPAAQFNHPLGVAVDTSGNIYVADTNNNIIRKITSGGVVSTLAGVAGSGGFTDGTGSGALFHLPNGLAADSSGNIYVADTANSTIRKIAPGGVVTTLAGLPTIAGLQNGTGSNALFNQPEDLTVDSAGNVYVADTGNAAIREITPAGAVTTLAVPNKAFIASPVASSPAPNSPTPSSGGGGGGGAFDDWFLAALAVASLLRLRPGQT